MLNGGRAESWPLGSAENLDLVCDRSTLTSFGIEGIKL